LSNSKAKIPKIQNQRKIASAMKKILTQILLIIAISSQAQTEKGIIFIHDNWATAMAQAKKEKKIIFMDAHTSWCGPCKAMAKNVFTLDEVANVYNKQFINLKMDMEKGDGVQLANTYSIKAYPTLLFIDAEGKVVHKALGYHDTEQFLELAKTAQDKDNRIGTWESKYAKGDRSEKFLKEYALKLNELSDPKKDKVASEYLATQKDWSTPNNQTFLLTFVETIDSKLFNYLLENKTSFYKQFGEHDIKLKIENLVESRLADPKNLPTLSFADSLMTKLYDGDKAKRQKLRYRTTYFRLKGDREGYAKATINYLKKYDDNIDELEEAATTFNEQINDKSQIKKAICWAEKANDKEKMVARYKLIAQLYVKADKNSKAIKTLNKGIEFAKEYKESDTELQEMLKGIQK
jgi:thioredoxin-related protein